VIELLWLIELLDPITVIEYDPGTAAEFVDTVRVTVTGCPWVSSIVC
jgi:hypothetical protein